MNWYVVDKKYVEYLSKYDSCTRRMSYTGEV